MKDKKRVKEATSKHLCYSDIKNISTVNGNLYNINDIQKIFGISRRDIKTSIDSNNMFQVQGELYIPQSELKLIMLKYGGSIADGYIDKLIGYDECIHEFGYYIDDFIISNEPEINKKLSEYTYNYNIDFSEDINDSYNNKSVDCGDIEPLLNLDEWVEQMNKIF